MQLRGNTCKLNQLTWIKRVESLLCALGDKRKLRFRQIGYLNRSVDCGSAQITELFLLCASRDSKSFTFLKYLSVEHLLFLSDR